MRFRDILLLTKMQHNNQLECERKTDTNRKWQQKEKDPFCIYLNLYHVTYALIALGTSGLLLIQLPQSIQTGSKFHYSKFNCQPFSLLLNRVSSDLIRWQEAVLLSCLQLGNNRDFLDSIFDFPPRHLSSFLSLDTAARIVSVKLLWQFPICTSMGRSS